MKVIDLARYRAKHNTLRAEGRTLLWRGLKLTLSVEFAESLGNSIWDMLNEASQSAGAYFVISRVSGGFRVTGHDIDAFVTRGQLSTVGYEMLKAVSREKPVDLKPWRRG